MALTQIIQNVYTFANVLVQSGTGVVKHWDDKSLQNAFNWARYCIKIEEETCNKGYRVDLDQHIQSLTILLTPVTLLDLSLDTLRNSLILLCKRLLQNPACPPHVRNMVGNLSALTEQEMSVVLTCCGNHDDSAAGPCLYLLLGEDQQFESLSITSQGQRIMERLVKLQGLSMVSKNRFERFLMKLTKEVLSCPSGWDVLCGALRTEVVRPECHDGVEYVKGIILQALASSHTDTLLWQQSDQETLCELSSRDDRFLDLHLDHLLSVADTMEPVYGHTDTGDLYMWRCRQDRVEIQVIDTSFSVLVDHLSTFLRYDKRFKNTLVKTLRERGEQSYFNVWKDILKALQV